MIRTKTAALGGTGADKSFEEAVANLAHEFLADKAPALMRDELGFQMLDKSDDDSKGIGVCVFKPNGILMFAPIFFLNGEIKGHELLYLPEQDIFVPLKESWINEILGKKPSMIGDSVEKSYQRNNGMRNPDMSLFRTPPKFASWISPLIPELKKYMQSVGTSFSKTASLMIDSSHKLTDSTSLEKFLKYASYKGLRKLNKLINKSLLTKKAFSTKYPGVDLESMARQKEASARSKYLLRKEPTGKLDSFFKKANNNGFVSIISYSTTITTGTDFDLSEKEKEKLLRDQYLVLDNRPDSEISVIETSKTSFINPNSTGVYSILMADGSYKDFVVVKVLSFKQGNFFNDGDTPEFLVCEMGSHKGRFINNKFLFANKSYTHDKFKEWFNRLPDATNMSILNGNEGCVNFINDKGTCYGNIKTWDVTRVGDVIRMEDVEIGSKLTKKLKKMGGKLYVPEDCKIITSEAFYTPSYDKVNDFGEPELFKKAEAKQYDNIKLAVANDWCKINETTYPTKFAGFCALIKDYHLREKDARNLFKEAEANTANFHTINVRIKKAASLLDEDKLQNNAGLYFPEPAEGDQSIFGSNVPVGPSGAQSVQSDSSYYGLNEGPYNNEIENFPAMEMQQIQQALQSGQDEVFNLSILKQFLNDGDISSEIDHEIPELIKGMNHAGRMLFRYYWKGEKFKELYGPQEMPELESSLRKVFELLGDVILLLKHKLKKDDTYGELSKINLNDIQD